MVMRPSGRDATQLRPVTFEPRISRYAEGSCLVTFGHTRVMCTATVEPNVPGFLKNTGKGWITAEYGMLPRSTHSRMPREAAKGKVTGRTQEIQRLIGRALRSVADLPALGERQIILDCDVIEADGGTRTAAISGAYVALYLALQTLVQAGKIAHVPLRDSVAAISCGIVNGAPVLDLEYTEDSAAEVDANVVMTGQGHLVEVQGTGEEHTFTRADMNHLLDLAEGGIRTITALQRAALGLS